MLRGEKDFSVCYHRPQWSWSKVIFSEACVKNSVHGGHTWQGCVCGGQHVWQGGMCGRGVSMVRGAFMVGGMHGRVGACVAGWVHVWHGRGWGMHGRGAHSWQGGMCGRWHSWQGVYGRYYEIWSMSRQYASYWNAFLFGIFIRKTLFLKFEWHILLDDGRSTVIATLVG